MWKETQSKLLKTVKAIYLSFLLVLVASFPGQTKLLAVPLHNTNLLANKVFRETYPIKINYTIPGKMQVLKQPNQMACWATVATMLASWKEGKPLEIEEVLKRADSKYLGYFQAGKGLEAKEKNVFLKAMGLRAEQPQNFTPKGWLDLLQSYGPLWVTSQLRRNKMEEERFSVHARILIGMYDDLQGSELYLRVVDPEAGKQYDEKFEDFFRRYENIARENLETDTEFQPQVIHF